MFIRDEVGSPTIGDHSHDHDDHGHGGMLHGHGHGCSWQWGARARQFTDLRQSPCSPGRQVSPVHLELFLPNPALQSPRGCSVPGFGNCEINVTGALALSALGATFIFGAQAMARKWFLWKLIPDTGVPGIGAQGAGRVDVRYRAHWFFIKQWCSGGSTLREYHGWSYCFGCDHLGFIAVCRHSGSNVIYGMVVPGSILGQVFIGCLECLWRFSKPMCFRFWQRFSLAGGNSKALVDCSLFLLRSCSILIVIECRGRPRQAASLCVFV